MNRPLAVVAADTCWNSIGVWGDRSCPELANVTHCHNCPVFAAAGRRFLDVESPPGYLDDWTKRLAGVEVEECGEQLSVLVFRLGEEWLALPASVLVEVTRPRTPHRIPHRAGLLAGLVNIRGELHLCIRLEQLLGLAASAEDDGRQRRRLVVIHREQETWAFEVAEVDQTRRILVEGLTRPAPTLARASARITRGVFTVENHPVGLLEDARLFAAIRERTR